MVGTYKPKIFSMKDPEMPGSTRAQIAMAADPKIIQAGGFSMTLPAPRPVRKKAATAATANKPARMPFWAPVCLSSGRISMTGTTTEAKTIPKNSA